MNTVKLEKHGYYTDVVELPDGRLASVERYIYTWGLCVGIDMEGSGHQTRYCYDQHDENFANHALFHWDGKGDPPGPWIKQKPEDRSNPNA